VRICIIAGNKHQLLRISSITHSKLSTISVVDRLNFKTQTSLGEVPVFGAFYVRVKIKVDGMMLISSRMTCIDKPIH
jgi:hypothetical protein